MQSHKTQPRRHERYKKAREYLCNRNNRPKIKKEPLGAWLLIRYDSADTGVRPIPNGEVFWLSPDVWISGGDNLGNAIAGKSTGVHARLWNMGSFQATPTRVDFAFADPSLGIPFHTPQLIGTEWVSVPPLSSVVVDCPTPWIPAKTGTTHSCLKVTCSAFPIDPATDPWNVCLDRHVAQRNVTIVQRETVEFMRFEFAVGVTTRHLAQVCFFANAFMADHAEALLNANQGSLNNALIRIRGMATDHREKLIVDRALRLVQDQCASTLHAMTADELAEVLTVDEFPAGWKEVSVTNLDFGNANFVHLGNAFMPKDLSVQRLRGTLRIPKQVRNLLVNFWQLEGKEVTGGYTIVFINKRRTIVRGFDETSIEKLVLRAHPGAQTTYEIVCQLSGCIPCKSLEQFINDLGKVGISIRGERISASQLAAILPKDVFPIKDLDDLVVKVSAAVKIGADIVQREGRVPKSKILSKLAMDITGGSALETHRVATGFFGGPSVFGCEVKEEEG